MFEGQKINVEYANWKKDDGLIQSWIRGSFPKKLCFSSVDWTLPRRCSNPRKPPFTQGRKDQERSFVTRLHDCRKNSLVIWQIFKEFEGICDGLAATQKSVSYDDKWGSWPKTHEFRAFTAL